MRPWGANRNGQKMAWQRSSKLLAIGAVCLLALILLGAYLYSPNRSQSSVAREGLCASQFARLRSRPLQVEAKRIYSDFISEKDLQCLLDLMKPYWEYHRVGDALHALRLWGSEIAFPDESPYPVPLGVRVWQPRDMLGLYLDENAFREEFPSSQPYFFISPHGLGERKASDLAATVHDNNFLHLAAEIGLPIDTPLLWGGRRFTLADVFDHSFYWFDLAQELEFTAVAYGMYLLPRASWTNRFGESYSLDRVAEELVDRDLTKCSCYGTHVPYALAVLLAVDEQEPVLSDQVSQKARRRLRVFADNLEKSQSAAGWWNRKWTPELRSKKPFESEEIELVRSTGHHLEWIALAPAECRPSDACVRRTIQRLLNVLSKFHSNIPPAYFFSACSHAGRALVLLSGRHHASEFMAGKSSKRVGMAGKPIRAK